MRPTVVRVDLAAVRHNVRTLAATAGTEVCAVVKADAYGHGAVEVGRAALEAGASWLGVALVEEGATLRRAGIDAPILLLSEPPVAGIGALLDARLTPVVYQPPFLAALDAAAADRGETVSVHVKADTGMGRVGVPPRAWTDLLRQAAGARSLVVDGLMTHLACADEPERDVTGDQLAGFERFLAAARGLGLEPRWIHAANTAGTLLHPAARHDLVRPGIGVYGLSPAPAVDAAEHGLLPALSLVSQVSFAKRVEAGTAVSYGHRWAAPTDGWVATVPVGYADGVPRRLTGHGEVLLGGARRPIAGTVTMDQLLVWCGDLEPAVGDEVVLLGRQGDEQLRVEDWARHLGTITYELTSQLTSRLPRTYVGGQPPAAG
ncbi:alanine racemase [Nitriliruptor alkaliphilus]|uniref:alanine racemase n=1 Tax=Nitriliruptor alkaliphilus TaxID=427918 RepID=UPI00147038AA|nr:alanine racemase [Nitriliruptor alkaliphilus]